MDLIAKDGFSKIPHEIMMYIMNSLEATDIISLSMVNKKIRSHTRDNYLWKQIVLEQYGKNVIEEEPKNLYRRGKWKRSKGKLIFAEPNWLRAYMRLSTVKVTTKSAHSRGKSGAYYRFKDFDKKNDEESPPGNKIKEKQRSFNIEITVSNVPPGIYDIIWRMKIDKITCKPIIHFNTDIWLRHDIYLNSYERESKYKYSPNPDELSTFYDKGWFHFRLPYQIIINKKEQFDDRRYQIHTGIICQGDKLLKNKKSLKVNEDNVNGNNIIYPKLKKLVNKFLKVIRKKGNSNISE
ncbi:23590_t:CDS:2 [Entrophospora sp. SA101]|nr:3139_t:CDS:2 [Entrophospora sp. SA101]CAJ0749465.1 23590_t:CDS:2 [Entrophospora sp. SA101]CAJ0894128.1 17368_t:CDS:2 [Entrophospora sp. SA101]